MTLAEEIAAPPSEPEVTTITARRVLRRSLFWIVVATIAAIVVALIALFAGASGDSVALSPTDASPAGAQALVRVLEQQGVTVEASDSLARTKDAVAEPEDTTILVYDHSHYLDSDQLDRLGRLASRIVLVDPDFTALQALVPSVLHAGDVSGTIRADCDLPAATQAGSIRGNGSGYRLAADSAGAIACFGSGDDTYSLIQVTSTSGSTITVVGTTGALENGHIAEHGDAALAINLLGETHRVVWYLPGLDDVPRHGGPTLAELTPAWVTPLGILVIVTAIVAGLWRGRRMGALVVERLPVTVKASETMEGRARLYAAGSAREHALDALRIGTIERLSALCGLPRLATVDEVVDAVAAIGTIDPSSVRALLLTRAPASDAELVTLSDELLDLERRVASALKRASTNGTTEQGEG